MQRTLEKWTENSTKSQMIVDLVFAQKGTFSNKLRILSFHALSFYVTKAVLVGPKWFWSNQIDLDLTLMIWSRPK